MSFAYVQSSKYRCRSRILQSDFFACLPLVNRRSSQVSVVVVPLCLPCRIYFWDRIHAFFIVINRLTMYCVLVGGAVAP